MCVCVRSHTCHGDWGRDVRWALLCCFQAGFLPEFGVRLAINKPWQSSCLCPSHSKLGLHFMWPCLAFYVHYKDLNSDPHACVAKVFTSKPSSQPLTFSALLASCHLVVYGDSTVLGAPKSQVPLMSLQTGTPLPSAIPISPFPSASLGCTKTFTLL